MNGAQTIVTNLVASQVDLRKKKYQYSSIELLKKRTILEQKDRHLTSAHQVDVAALDHKAISQEEYNSKMLAFNYRKYEIAYESASIDCDIAKATFFYKRIETCNSFLNEVAKKQNQDIPLEIKRHDLDSIVKSTSKELAQSILDEITCNLSNKIKLLNNELRKDNALSRVGNIVDGVCLTKKEVESIVNQISQLETDLEYYRSKSVQDLFEHLNIITLPYECLTHVDAALIHDYLQMHYGSISKGNQR